MKILICGLPTSGKTTLSKALSKKFISEGVKSIILNGDSIRKEFDDWDFSYDGRLRQVKRIKVFADILDAQKFIVIADFIAPTEMIRTYFNSDYTIWVDTINKSPYEETDLLFENPIKYDMRIIFKDAKLWASKIIREL